MALVAADILLASGRRPSRLTYGLPAWDRWSGATPREDWDGVHIPTLPDATPGIEKGGSLRPRPPVPARRSRPGGRGATENRPTTYEVADMHVRSGVSRTSGSVSHVRPSHGTGRASRFRTTVSQIASCAPRRSLRDEPDLDDRPLVEQPFAGELFLRADRAVHQPENRTMARTEKTSALPTAPVNGGPESSEKCDSLIGKPALARTAVGFTRPPGQRNCGSEFRDGSSDLYFPTPAGTTVQELLGVRQALAARALVARAVVMLDDAGRRDVQLGLRPLGSSLAHHKDVCASMGAEKPTPPMTLASNKACRALAVRDRIPQLNKCRASAIEPSRLNANWPIQHPRCTSAPS